MTTTYRVHFPGLTMDLKKDFTDENEARRFYNTRRDASGIMFRHVQIEKIEETVR